MAPHNLVTGVTESLSGPRQHRAVPAAATLGARRGPDHVVRRRCFSPPLRGSGLVCACAGAGSLARRPSCGRVPAAVGESRVGWGAAARVPRLLERQAEGLKRGQASSHGLLAHRARGSGGSGPGPCRAARGALGPGGARSLGRGAAGPGGNRPLSAPPAGSRRPVVPRGAGDPAQRLPVLTECADGSLENARSETPCCSGGP